MRTWYFDTEDQSVPREFEPETAFLTERTRRKTLGLELGQSRKVSELWRVNWGGDARQYSIEPVTADIVDAPPELFGDQDRFSVWLGADKQVSERTNVAMTYSHRFYRPELSEDEDIDAVEGRLSRVLGRRTTMNVAGGLARRRGAEADETGFEGRFRLTHDLEHGKVDFTLSQSLDNANFLAGGSTVSRAGLGYSDSTRRHWDWALFSSYALRRPVAAGQPDVKLFQGGFKVGFRGPRLQQGPMQNAVGFRVRATWNDQTGEGDPALDAGYYVVSAAVVVYLGV